MKPALTTTTTILGCVLAAALASAQSPTIIQNTRNTMNAVSNHATATSNEALGIHRTAPTASAAHAPTRTNGPATVMPAKSSSSSAPAGARSAGRKRRDHEKRFGEVLVGQSEEPAPTTAPEESASAAANVASVPGGGEGENEQSVAPDPKHSANGRRDPFISPVVSHAGGSGCSTGKKCLEIGTINLRGVVHAESGFIAVVSNGMNKAYFLRENDPVFNGYVMKITGDSIVFQETLQDRLGKTFTREVVKKITTPAV